MAQYDTIRRSTESSTSSLLNFDWGLDYSSSYQYNTPRHSMFPTMPGVSNSWS
ncbi:hypothetical protein B0H14DRAFT_3467144 [Mycena olivaceomarginata]|nr:hypothetical protein B0H14DRAFT_3467144 [Mycena olivaceomarginata]